MLVSINSFGDRQPLTSRVVPTLEIEKIGLPARVVMGQWEILVTNDQIIIPGQMYDIRVA